MHLSEFTVSSNNLNTFDNLSQLTESESTDIPQTGGFFGLFAEGSNIDRAVLEAVRLKKYDVVAFLVDKDLITTYRCKDENGNTLLHYLALDYDATSHIIDKIIKRKDVKSFINIQNNNGDTPLILSVIGSQHDLCEKFINKGADKTIKNSQSFSVETETDTTNSINVKPLSTTSFYNLSSEKEKYNRHKRANYVLNEKEFLKRPDIFNSLNKLFKNHHSHNNTSVPNTFSELPMNSSPKSPNIFNINSPSDSDSLLNSSVNTEKFIIEITNKLNNEKNAAPGPQVNNLSDDLLKKLMNGGNNKGEQYDNMNTEFLLNELQSKMKNMKGGDCGSYQDTEDLLKTLKNNQSGGDGESDAYSNTDNLINTLRNHMVKQNQDGGVRKRKTSKKSNNKSKGKRIIPKFVDGRTFEDEDDEDLKEPKYTELARILNNQTGDIIANIIKKIQEIITKNKKDFEKVSAEVAKGTEEVAKIYKSALWSSVKNDPKKALKSSLDIAVELQKILSKDLLLEVDYKKWEKIIKDHAEEKAKSIKMAQESSTISLSDASYSSTSSYEVDTFNVSETSNSD